MKILNKSFSVKNYKGILNKNLDLSEIVDVFSSVNVKFFKEKIALWKILREPFNKNKTPSKSINDKEGVLIEGKEITSAILGEAVEYLCRSFYNFYAQDKLMEHSFLAWAGVTNYYSSFFSIHSLLRLQGRCITLIWRPRGKKFYIFPYDFVKHQYVVCTNGVRKSAHDAVWNIFYDIYDSFDYQDNLYFESIFKRKYVGTVDEEIDFRTQINYEPYQGYDEIRDPDLISSNIEKYESKKFSENEIESLSYLATDPYYKFYARSILRIIFSYTLLKQIATKNDALGSLLAERRTTLFGFLQQVNPRNDPDMMCQRLQNLMGLEVLSDNDS